MSDVVNLDPTRRSVRPKAQPVAAAASDQQPSQPVSDLRTQRFLEARAERLRRGVTHC